MYIVPVLFNDTRGDMDDEDEKRRISFVRHEFQTENPFISDTMFRHKNLHGRPFLVVPNLSDIPQAEDRCRTELKLKFDIYPEFGKPTYHNVEWIGKNFDFKAPISNMLPWNSKMLYRMKSKSPKPKRCICNKKR